MDRHRVAATLLEIASYLDLKGENAFKVRAFQNAARAVETFPGDVAAALASGELAAAKGLGPATLEVVRECVDTGRSGTLDALRAEVPAGLLEMLRIGGMGVAKVRAVREQLGIESVAELEAAARDGRLARLPRFGEKTAAKILRGVEFLGRTRGLQLFHHAARQADQLREALAALDGVAHAEVAGDVRRRGEVVRDLDLAVATTSAAPSLAELLVRSGAARQVVGADAAGFALRLDGGAIAAVRCAPPERFGHALLWATGSDSHLALTRERAASLGLALDAAGISRDGTAVACPDEEALYRALGLAWIPPELREGTDEVARAAAGPLPRLVELADLRGFLHCHTTFSDGADSVAELAAACGEQGYSWVGITDHSQAAAYAGGIRADAIARQHEEIDAWNRGSSGPRVLKGIEADILADGGLDYGPDVLDRFDFVIGAIHSRFELAEDAMTERVLRAMEDQRLTILAHPTGRLLLTRDPYAIDMRRVIARAAELRVAIEINGDPQRLDLDWRLCREARDAGVAISIGADAHSIPGLANAELGVGIARKGWLEARDILNSKDAEGFLGYAKARR